MLMGRWLGGVAVISTSSLIASMPQSSWLVPSQACALSKVSYSAKILALYDAEYVRVLALAGTSGSGTGLVCVTG
jgi:hypothetical protein